jgi:hypothetical protein
MFAALILHTFQIVFLGHCDHPFRISSFNAIRGHRFQRRDGGAGRSNGDRRQ